MDNERDSKSCAIEIPLRIAILIPTIDAQSFLEKWYNYPKEPLGVVSRIP